MPWDAEYTPQGDATVPGEYWLYVWMRRVAAVAAHVIAVGFTVLMALLSRPGTSLFSWHPTCMCLAYCLCMTEGILLFSTDGSPFCCKSWKCKVRLHWLLLMLALGAGATGLGFMVASKNVSERPHLATWHSLLGSGSLVATVTQAILGLGLQMVRRGPTLTRLRLYHATCGLVAYLLAVATVMLGVCSDWFQATVRGVLWYAFLLLPLFPALVVMNQVTSAYLPRRKVAT